MKRNKLLILALGFACLGLIYAKTTPSEAHAGSFDQTSTPTPFLPSTVLETVVPTNILGENWQVEILDAEQTIVEVAMQFDLDLKLVASVAVNETGSPLNCPNGPISGSCTGSSGEIGPMQCMPYHFTSDEDPRDLLTGFRCGARVLRAAIDAAGGNIRLGLAAYNCGPNGDYAVNPKCLDYADDVLAIYEEHVGYPYPGTN